MGYIYIHMHIFIYIYRFLSPLLGKQVFYLLYPAPKKRSYIKTELRGLLRALGPLFGENNFSIFCISSIILGGDSILYIYIFHIMPIQRDLSYSGCLYKGNRVLCIVFSLKLKPIPDFFAQGPLKLTRFPKMLSQSV